MASEVVQYFNAAWAAIVTSPSAEPAAHTEGDGSNRPVALDPLDKDSLRGRMSELFPLGYLTLMAIVQGVALVELIDSVDNKVFSSHTDVHRPMAAAQALAVLGGIVIITHRYFLLTALTRWRPTVVDTLLPYLLGASEAAAALRIGEYAAWWIAFSVLFLIATASFVHTLMHANEAVYGNLHDLYTASRSSVRKLLITCSALMFFSASIALITIYSGPLPVQTYVIFICGIIVAVIIVTIIGERARNIAYSNNDIPDWRESIKDKGASG
jgi:hypothetical protein